MLSSINTDRKTTQRHAKSVIIQLQIFSSTTNQVSQSVEENSMQSKSLTRCTSDEDCTIADIKCCIYTKMRIVDGELRGSWHNQATGFQIWPLEGPSFGEGSFGHRRWSGACVRCRMSMSLEASCPLCLLA